MKLLIVLISATIAVAYPEAGYIYNKPNNIQSHTIVGGLNKNLQGLSTNNILGYNYQAPLSQSTLFGQASNDITNVLTPPQASPSIFGGQANLISPFQNGNSNFGIRENTIQQKPLVQKHIYVHVAPPDTEEVKQQQQVIIPQAQKHYKIIFIKAPSSSVAQQRIIAKQAANEEKTLIYVLSKKEDAANIPVDVISTPSVPTKPEVYFIKYKTKQEASVGSGLDVNNVESSNIIPVQQPASLYGPPPRNH